MSKQNYFNYHLDENKDSLNFFVNHTNKQTSVVINNNQIIQNIFIDN